MSKHTEQEHPLKAQWLALCARHSDDRALAEELWAALQAHYTAPERAYHNLAHIHHLLLQAAQHAGHLDAASADELHFAIWYHDVVYKAGSRRNERRSAKLAAQHLAQLGLPAARIAAIGQMIVATRRHQVPPQAPPNTAWLLDFDMAILAAAPDVYRSYTRKIAQEHRRFPSFFYRMGRERFLQALLASQHIFHTPLYRDTLEAAARENLRRELWGS